MPFHWFRCNVNVLFPKQRASNYSKRPHCMNPAHPIGTLSLAHVKAVSRPIVAGSGPVKKDAMQMKETSDDVDGTADICTQRQHLQKGSGTVSAPSSKFQLKSRYCSEFCSAMFDGNDPVSKQLASSRWERFPSCNNSSGMDPVK